MWSEHVTLEYPYHFEEVLKRLSFDPLNVIQLDEKVIYVPLFIDEEQIVVRLQGIGTVQNPQFWISSQAGDQEKVMKRMRFIFHWNQPFQNIQNHFLNTSLRPLFETYAYTPIILEFDYFACSSLYYSSTNKFEICYCANRSICKTIWDREERRFLFPNTEKE